MAEIKNNKKIIIIGCGDAGISAAVTLLRMSKDSEITIIEKEKYFYPRCPLPFVIGGEIVGTKKIIKKIEDMFSGTGINVVCDTVLSINPGENTLRTKNHTVVYDYLIMATGASCYVPPIKGSNLSGCYTLRTIEDTREIMKRIVDSESAIVIGGGAIGLEVASAFINHNLDVTVVEVMNRIMANSFDPNFSKIIEEYLKDNGIKILTGAKVNEITERQDRKGEVGGVIVDRKFIPADLVVFSTGIRANSELAEHAGIKVSRNGIVVNEKLQTSIPNIYACGDCIEIEDILTGKKVQSGYGTQADREGHIAGINIAGGVVGTFEGTLGSVVTKAMDLEIGRTGLMETEAKEAGYETVSGIVKTKTKPDYYPGAKDFWTHLIFDAKSEKLLGAQIAGGEDVVGYVNLASMALQKGNTLHDTLKFKYSYAPPICSAPSPFVLAAENAYKKLERLKKIKKRTAK